MNTELLNKLQSPLINFANERGINLQAEFGTVEAFKRFVIALAFKVLVDAGIGTQAAFDFVFGNGEYDRLATNVWEAANGNQQPAKAST